MELEKFRVTGTHIQRTELEGMLPVFSLDRTAIDQSGATTVNELFDKVIYNNAGIVDEQFTQGFAPASAGVDLRGLGVSRTLVLLDGRRMPSFPFAQNGSESFVDINLIPLSAVERVEVLKDGASAVYGSDAIAGVVNIILRKDYQGAEVSAAVGQTSESDGEEGHFAFTGGLTGPRGNFTFGLDYLDRDPVWSRDRDISESANGPIDDRSRAGNPGTTIRAAGFPEPDPRCPADRISPEKGPFCLYDFAPHVTLIPETERLGLSASGNYDLSPALTFFARGNYTYSDTERDLAPTTGMFSVDGTNPNNIYPGEDVQVIYRLLELGPRTDEFETDAYNLLAGVAGTYGVWDWEFGLGGGKVDTKIRGESGYATQTDVQNAIDNGSLNPYGDSPGLDVGDLTYHTQRDGDSTLYYADFKATGYVLALPHGDLVSAVGVEYRDEDFSDKFDPVTESGDVLGIGGLSADGDRHSTSGFIELSVPLLAGLEAQIAGRYDHYSDFGGTTNPKLGLRWQPHRDLLLRASGGTGFKAPTLQELYSEEIFSFETVYDPVTGDLVEVPTFSSGNSDLDAEESDNYSLGLVWDITRSWNISVDWWRIKNKNAVTSNPQYYVDNEANFPGNVIRDPSDNIVVIFSPFQNVAEQKAWGIDLDTGVGWQTLDKGRFSFNLYGSYLGSFEEEPVPGAGFEELAGNDGRPRFRGQGILGWDRANLQASVSINYTGEYDRPAVNDDINDWTTVDAQFNWRPHAVPGGTLTFGMENLLDEEPPEDVYLEGWPFFNRALHNPRGRFFYLRYKHEF